MRSVLLIDMDYFYAACEEVRHEGIREKPVVVGADPKGGRGRGVVMTCNYIARRYGIRSAMPISVAYRTKPDAIFLPMDYPYYEQVSGRVMDVIKGFGQRFEQVSIDEAFVEMADADGIDSLEYAKRIKAAIKESVGLDCSIGISYNKLMAKMASDAAKPNGIKAVKKGDEHRFLDSMPLEELYSVGSKTKERLEAMHFRTIGDLARANKMALMAEFGALGLELHNYANGIDESELAVSYTAKSIGREMTFEEDTADKGAVAMELKRLSGEVAGEAMRLGFLFRNVTVKLRYSDFSERLRSKAVKASADEEELYAAAGKLYLENAEKKKIRKVGVRVSDLVRCAGQKRLG